MRRSDQGENEICPLLVLPTTYLYCQRAAPPPCSWTFQESEVEGCEYQDDSYVHRQPFPEPVLEEQDIDRDDHGCHQDYVECGGRLASHFSPRLTVRRSSGYLLAPPF